MLIDAGHGAKGNEGNTGVQCQKEQDVMRWITDRVVPGLRAPGVFDVRTTRPSARTVEYGPRITLANTWSDVFVSLHSDARAGDGWAPDPITGCNRATGAAGFSVLWSDEGDAELVEDRHALARAIAAALIQAGFPAYPNYGNLYDVDPDHPGVFVDRHEDAKRIRMLRRPTVPSVIVETHQALDPQEVARWQDPRTVDVFTSALRRALVAWFERPPPG
ncbi:MAG: N-acetylmuramoyl-L-alanine amidase [Myxococcota bacterium]